MSGRFDAEPPHVFPREIDEVAPHAISNAARSAVQHEPYVIGFIEADLDEVIAGPERPEVIGVLPPSQLGCLVRIDIVPRDFNSLPRVLKLSGGACQAPRSPDLPLVGAAVRHSLLDRRSQFLEIVREIVRVQAGFDSHHAAADIYTDRGWNDRALGRDYASDGGADAIVHVGHGRDPFVDERQLRGVQELLARRLLQGDALWSMP